MLGESGRRERSGYRLAPGGLHEMGADIGDFPAGKLGSLLVEITFNLFGRENIDIEMIGLTLDGPIPSEYEKTFDRTMVAQLIFER
jgi:hypothetical protein